MDCNSNSSQHSKSDIDMDVVVKTEKWDTDDEEDKTDMDWKREDEDGQSNVSSDESSQHSVDGVLKNNKNKKNNNNSNNNVSSVPCLLSDDIIEVDCKKCQNNFTSLKNFLDHLHKKSINNNCPSKENHHLPGHPFTPKIISVSSSSSTNANTNSNSKLPLNNEKSDNNNSECDPDPDPDLEPQSDPLQIPESSFGPKLPFKCIGCEQGFQTKHLYDAHMRTTIPRTKCPASSICPLTFTLNCAMLKHIQRHKEEAEEFATKANTQKAAPKTYGRKPRLQPISSQPSSSSPSSSPSQALSVSMVSIGIQVGIPCPIADGFHATKKLNKTQHYYNSNIQVRKDKSKKCVACKFDCDRPNCLKSFKNQEALDEHIRRHENIENSNIAYKKFRCVRGLCTKSYDDEDSLAKHINEHLVLENFGVRKATCHYPGCKRVFKRRKGKNTAYKEHLEFHRLGCPSIKCTKNPSFCSKTFDCERQLRDHMRLCGVPENGPKNPDLSRVLDTQQVRVSPRASKGKAPDVYRPDKQRPQQLHKPNKLNKLKIGRPRNIDAQVSEVSVKIAPGSSSVPAPVDSRVSDCFVAISKNIIMDVDDSPEQEDDQYHDDGHDLGHDDDLQNDNNDVNDGAPDLDNNNAAQDDEEAQSKDKDKTEERDSKVSQSNEVKVSKKKVQVNKRYLNSKVVRCPICPGNVYCTDPLTLESHMKKRHSGDPDEDELDEDELPPPKKVKVVKTVKVPVQCECRYSDCGKIFKSWKEVGKHYGIAHGGKRPPVSRILCPREGCGKLITNSPRLMRIHIKRDHEGIRDFLCNTCGATFFNLNNLKRHEIAHNDERPFKCTWPDCTATFKRIRSQQKHILVHTNEKNYLCSQCARAFKTSDALNVHLRLHSDEKLFKCPICPDVGYNHKVTLKHHMQKSHPDFEGQL